jgi:uncharacterized protein YndB with AHSA1/START domain
VGKRLDLEFHPVETVTAFVACDPTTCFRAFTDARHLTAWVPGLRRADILSKARGLAAEVHFEFANELAYTLEYSYDIAKREVSWKPKLGAAAGVSGQARFEDAASGGTQFTYALVHGEGRSAAEQELGNLAALVAAFVTWVSEPGR